MRRAFVLAATLAILAAVAEPVRAQAPPPDAARVAAAKELMDLAGVAKQFDTIMPLLAKCLSEAFVAIAPAKADEIRQVFSQVAVRFIDRKGELIDQIAALYAQKLGMEDLQAIIAFYKSPPGRRFLEIQPDMTREAMTMGQRWGADIGREIEAEARRELKKRGIEL
jgi:hypothetical protein